MSDVIKLPVPIASAKSAGEHAQDETQRKKAWFAWGDAVLAKVGVTNRVNSARTEQELNHIVFDEYKNKIEVLAAIHDALHPASGEREQHFRGLTEATLKRILQNRFEELLKERRDVLARNMFGQKPPPHWSDKLVKTVSGSVMPLLANYALILQNAPKWKGVLGYNEFALQVAIRKPPPWGDQASDTPWSDDAESQTRIFFQRHYGLAPGVGDIGRAVQAAARRNPFHPVRDHLERLKWDGVSRLETWPQTYCGASDSPYVRAVAKRWLISGLPGFISRGHRWIIA